MTETDNHNEERAEQRPAPAGCEAVEASLVDYHFRELDAAQRRAVRAHLAACGRCARGYCQLAADLEELSPAGAGLDERPSPRAAQRLRDAVAREFRPPWWRRAVAPLQRRVPAYQLVIATALLLGAMVALLTLGRRGGDRPPGRSRPAIVSSYDASTILAVDPELL